MSINFFAEGIEFMPENQSEIRKWVSSVISDKKKTPGTINYIFCSNDYLLGINLKYLNHDTYTDIITFDYSSGKVISGDIFISVDMVSENAIKFNQPFSEELNRVLVHGILHLCGQKDKTDEESIRMRSEEEHYLAFLKNR